MAYAASSSEVNQPINPRADVPGQGLNTVPCHQLAVAFHLTSPILLALISLIVPPVLSFPVMAQTSGGQFWRCKEIDTKERPDYT